MILLMLRYDASNGACEKAGIPTKLRQKEFYEKPTAERKRKRAAAVKRYQKKLSKERETIPNVAPDEPDLKKLEQTTKKTKK